MNYVNFFIKAKVSSFQLIFSCKVYWTGDAHFHCLNFVRCHINKVAEILVIEIEQKIHRTQSTEVLNLQQTQN